MQQSKLNPAFKHFQSLPDLAAVAAAWRASPAPRALPSLLQLPPPPMLVFPLPDANVRLGAGQPSEQAGAA